MQTEKPYRVVRRGKEYWYHRKGRDAQRLFSDPGTPEFTLELQAAYKNEKTRPIVTISDLVLDYQRSKNFLKNRPSTKKNWRPWFDRIEIGLGTLRVKTFESSRSLPPIRKWRSKWEHAPRTADYGVQVLSAMLSYARKQGLIERHHCKDVGTLYRSNRAGIVWDEGDIEKLSKHASPELIHVAKLALLTGFRQSDLLNMKWSNVKDDVISIQTGKSNHTIYVDIPLYPALKELLDKEIPKRADTILTTTRGKPWKTGFTSSWNKAIKRAGIDKHFNDLRGTAATQLYKANMPIEDIACLLGWSVKTVNSIIDRYVNRKALIAKRNIGMQQAVRQMYPEPFLIDNAKSIRRKTLEKLLETPIPCGKYSI